MVAADASSKQKTQPQHLAKNYNIEAGEFKVAHMMFVGMGDQSLPSGSKIINAET